MNNSIKLNKCQLVNGYFFEKNFLANKKSGLSRRKGLSSNTMLEHLNFLNLFFEPLNFPNQCLKVVPENFLHHLPQW